MNYFFDIDEEADENTKSVARTIVKDIFLVKKDKWWMQFDYGDDWVFELEYIDDKDGYEKSGTVVKKSGDVPKQY